MWILLIVIISLIPLVVTWFTSPEDIFIQKGEGPSPKREIFKRRTSWRLTKRGKAFVALFLLTGFFAFMQDLKSKDDTRQAKEEAKKELHIRDSLANDEQDRRDSISYNRFDSANLATVKALAEYSLEVDSATGRIIKTLRDSAKRTIINGPEPVLEIVVSPGDEDKLRSNHVNGNRYEVVVPLVSREANSANLNVVIHVAVSTTFIEEPFDYKYSHSMNPFKNFSSVNKDGGPTYTINTDGANYLWLWIKGTYTRLGGKQVHAIDRLYYCDVRNNRSGLMGGNIRKIITDRIIKSKKVFQL